MPESITNLPSKVDLFTFPRWALVAFTLRCAERVFPLIERANYSYAESAAELIHIAVQAARTGDSIASSKIHVACSTPQAGSDDLCAAFFVVNRLDIILRAALVSARAALKDEVFEPHELLAYSMRSAEAASAASLAAWNAVRATAQGKCFIAQAIHRDFELLRSHSISNLACGLNPEVFGPLWPCGIPDWYYESELLRSSPSAFDSLPTLDVYFDPGDASKKSLQRVMEALSKLHIAAGGGGLIFQPDDGLVYVREQVPV